MSQVILVNEKDEAIGVMAKTEAHTKGLLHRAFSIFIFNEKGEMLLQQRADNKYHSAGLWTNACCSHPRPGEGNLAAAHRRLKEEMGFDTFLNPAFNFTYHAVLENGLIENEYDYVFIGNYNGLIFPSKTEVNNYCFMPMDEIENDMKAKPRQYTFWFKIAFPKLLTFLK